MSATTTTTTDATTATTATAIPSEPSIHDLMTDYVFYKNVYNTEITTKAITINQSNPIFFDINNVKNSLANMTKVYIDFINSNA